MRKKEDFAPKTFTKQEVGLKTKFSYREIPIPDYVFEEILKERQVYEANRNRRKSFRIWTIFAVLIMADQEVKDSIASIINNLWLKADCRIFAGMIYAAPIVRFY